MTDLQGIFREIEAEWPRSLKLHPWAKWERMTYADMDDDLNKELDEMMFAYQKGNFDGEHGFRRESVHSIIVLIRRRMELERRQHD